MTSLLIRISKAVKAGQPAKVQATGTHAAALV